MRVWMALLAVAALAAAIAVKVAEAFSGPTLVLSGLAQPAEPATSAGGAVYFTQRPASGVATISRLENGGHNPVEVYRLDGSQPYVNDLHADSQGDLVFIASVATGASSRRWALTRLDAESGAASELVVTTGFPAPTLPPFLCIGSGCGLLGGTEIDLAGVDGGGTIYFAEHSTDPGSGRQTAGLFALRPGTTAPREVAHFESPGGYDLVAGLTVARTGEVYFTVLGPPRQDLYQLSNGSLRVLIAGQSGGPGPRLLHAGLDAAGDLYVIRRTFGGLVRYGCADSTTVRIVRFGSRDLAGGSPEPTTVSEATYDGFVANWGGSSSFFAVSGAGEVAWVQSQIDCASGASVRDEVVGTEAGGRQVLVYRAPTATSDVAAQGPLGIAAARGGDLTIASTAAGELLRAGGSNAQGEANVEVNRP